MTSLLTRAGAVLALASTGSALAHPGHGADLIHAHDDWVLGIVLLVALVIGAVGIVRLLRRR
jgi:hypothetical protein